MNQLLVALSAVILFAPGSRTSASHPAIAGEDTTRWRADHHMHLASADLCSRIEDCRKGNIPLALYAEDAIRVLDEAFVSKGVILSCAYLYGMPSLHLPPDSVARFTQLENDFTAAEVRKYPDRLVGFLSVDPLEESAVAEIERWRGSTVLVGLKLHFAAMQVNLHLPEHRARIKRVLEAAAAQQLPMVIHVAGGKFSSAEAEIFIRDILPSAGDSPVQIAHAAGGVPVVHHAEVLRTFADHIVRNDPATRHLLFDLSYVPAPEEKAPAVGMLVKQMRRIGMERFLFGSDFDVALPREMVEWLHRLGLTPAEWQTVATNCAPWAC